MVAKTSNSGNRGKQTFFKWLTISCEKNSNIPHDDGMNGLQAVTEFVNASYNGREKLYKDILDVMMLHHCFKLSEIIL